MNRDRKDRSANWIVEKHADSLLRLANVSGFTAWQAVATVMSFPKQMPDGLLDVTFPGRSAPDPFLIEIESYPQLDTLNQIRDDAAMVLLTRGVLPDILLLNLAPKGNRNIDPEQIVQSAHGLSQLRLQIRVVNVWTLSADNLLAANDVGLIPWVPLAQSTSTPESLLQQCKERIEKQARPEEKGNLLAATRVMAEMRYNDQRLLSLLGEIPMSMRKIYEASPSIRALMADNEREILCKFILRRLDKHFGSVPEDIAADLRTIEDQNKLDDLFEVAIDCDSLDAFRSALIEPS